jgi:propanol-preferring alcohol dehydrogenase
MKAMVLESLAEVKPPQVPLKRVQHPEPAPGPGEVLLRVTRCGVCHTELDEIEGRTPPPNLPVILGHQVVGIVEGIQNLQILGSPDQPQRLEALESVQTGQRVGVAWIASACGRCQ